MTDHREPLFVRGWDRRKYYLNARHPLGLALTVLILVGLTVVLAMMRTRTGPYAPDPEPTWSPQPNHVYPFDPYGPLPSAGPGAGVTPEPAPPSGP
ncbi:hypothetical protein ACZ90_57850 [Streptomyces albus subsp. albus]|nr:hypothetical protein ACZ90_57850 [Streptomyces albus subsp. albus]